MTRRRKRRHRRERMPPVSHFEKRRDDKRSANKMPSCRQRRKLACNSFGGARGTVFGHFTPLRASQRLMQEQLQPCERIPPRSPERDCGRCEGDPSARHCRPPLGFALTMDRESILTRRAVERDPMEATGLSKCESCVLNELVVYVSSCSQPVWQPHEKTVGG